MIEFTLWDIIRNLLFAARWTVLLSIVAFIGGATVGAVILMLRISKSQWRRQFGKGYIALFQGTPLLMQLFLIYFGLPKLGIRIDPWTTAALGLTLYASAYLAEIWRSGVDSLPLGQWDGAASLGLTRWGQLRRIIFPQAFSITRAPAVGFLVQLIKSTAVTSIIGFQELLRAANTINNATFQPFIVYSIVAAIFFLLCYPLSKYSRIIEQREIASGISR